MITRTAINWAAALLIVAIYAAMQHLDGPTELQAQADQQADIQSAIKSEATQARFAGAASQICNGANWSQDNDGALLCHSHKGAM